MGGNEQMAAPKDHKTRAEIIRMRNEGYTNKAICKFLGLSRIDHFIKEMIAEGILEERLSTGTPKASRKRELYKKMNMKHVCHYDRTCEFVASKTWGLVPLCEGHHNIIQNETKLYYGGSKRVNTYKDRVEFLRISHLIPWAKEVTE